MSRKVAVFTDAMSTGYAFPHWHRYYARAVSAENAGLRYLRDSGMYETAFLRDEFLLRFPDALRQAF